MTTAACTEPGCTGSYPRRVLRRLRLTRDLVRVPGGGQQPFRHHGRHHRSRRRDLHPAGLRRHDRRRLLRRLRLTRGCREHRPLGRGRGGTGRPRADPVDGVASLEPSRLDRSGVRPCGGRRHEDHAPPRHFVDQVARCAPRCRADLDPASARRRREPGHHEEPDGPGGTAQLPDLRSTGRAVTGRPAGSHRGLLPEVPHPVLVRAQAEGGRPGRRSVRGGRRAGPRRARLDLRRS